MKKMISLILAVCLMLTLTVAAMAEGTGEVTELAAAASAGVVQVSGKATGVKAAVVVQILDAGGSVIGMESFVISAAGTFGGTVAYSGTPATARAADFDGGNWFTVGVTVTGGHHYHGDTVTVNAPATGDMGVALYAVLTMAGVAGGAMVMGKKKED